MYLFICLFIYSSIYLSIYLFVCLFVYIYIYTYCIPRFGKNRVCSSLKRKCFESLISLAETIPDLVFKRHLENKKDQTIVRLKVNSPCMWHGCRPFLSWTYIRVCGVSAILDKALSKSALTEEHRLLQGVVVAALQVSAKTYADAMNGWDRASVAVKRRRNLEFAYFGNTRHSNAKGGAGLGWKHLLWNSEGCALQSGADTGM